MPTMKSLEAALRALGWEPLEGENSSVVTRAWFHPATTLIIRTPRTLWVRPEVAARIMRRAKLHPYR